MLQYRSLADSVVDFNRSQGGSRLYNHLSYSIQTPRKSMGYARGEDSRLMPAQDSDVEESQDKPIF